MGVSGAAAQKRVERAVEKLRGMLRRRGMAVGSGTALAAGLEAYMTTPASAALVTATTQSALAAVQGGAVGGQLLAIAEGAMKMMAWAQVKVVAGVLITVMGVGAGAVVLPRWWHIACDNAAGSGDEPPGWEGGRSGKRRSGVGVLGGDCVGGCGGYGVEADERCGR